MRAGVRIVYDPSVVVGHLARHRPEEAASEEVAKQAHDLYCAYLLAARDRHGLSFLGPFGQDRGGLERTP